MTQNSKNNNNNKDSHVVLCKNKTQKLKLNWEYALRKEFLSNLQNRFKFSFVKFIFYYFGSFCFVTASTINLHKTRRTLKCKKCIAMLSSSW